MFGDGDRTEPLVASGLEQRLDRRRTVVAVVGVHVEVDVDGRARGQLAREGRVAGQGLAPGCELFVDRLELVGHQRPVTDQRRPGEPLAQWPVVDQARQLGGEDGRVLGFEKEPAIALPEDLGVDREA